MPTRGAGQILLDPPLGCARVVGVGARVVRFGPQALVLRADIVARDSKCDVDRRHQAYRRQVGFAREAPPDHLQEPLAPAVRVVN